MRTEEKAKKLAEITGVKTVVGSLQDHKLLEKLASSSHVVFSIVSSNPQCPLLRVPHSLQASSGAEPEMEAILRGLKKRHQATGDVPLLIRTVRLHVASL